MSERSKKSLEYSALITEAIHELFSGESHFHIDQEELMEGDNLTDFIHALANVVPCHIYNQFTGDNKNQLEFNQLANSLCFQYMKRDNQE